MNEQRVACKAETTSGAGRCRNLATSNGFCVIHQHGEGVKIASKPTKILLKANVNLAWMEKLARRGVERKDRDAVALGTAHAKEAYAHGRQPYAIRSVADSGTPVFGETGAQKVLVYDLLDELRAAEYRVADIHMFERKGQGKTYTLVITLIHRLTLVEVPIDPGVETFLGVTWGRAHVWANPPKADGTVVHTVNLTQRMPEDDPDGDLHFADGLWSIEAVTQ
jgi:hypothetical protein